jgi:hypothetical protein
VWPGTVTWASVWPATVRNLVVRNTPVGTAVGVGVGVDVAVAVGPGLSVLTTRAEVTPKNPTRAIAAREKNIEN